jgi:hypothetical protein
VIGVRDEQLPRPASRGCGQALGICPQLTESQAGRGKAPERREQLAHDPGHLREPRAARPELTGFRYWHAGPDIVDHPGGVTIEVEIAHPRQRDASLGRRRPQPPHHPKPVLSILPAAVALDDHSLTVVERDHVSAVR